MELKDQKILVTGGHGFIGSVLVRKLGERNVPPENVLAPTSEEYDFRTWEACRKAVEGRDLVIHLAAKVGGIGFNREHPGELFYDNIMMGAQLMEAARQAGVKKFVGIATICAYPKFTPVPFKEDDLWNGYPEETNAPYGLAKKMLLVQAGAYRQEYGLNAITLFPINAYGPGDNFDPARSHVIAALVKKISDAKKSSAGFIEAWGSGNATRGFVYVEDAAEGILLAAEKYDKPEPVNIGSPVEISIRDLVALLMELMDWHGEVRWDSTKPDGQPRRALDVSRAEKEFGFLAKTDFREGLKKMIEWYEKKPL